MNHQSPIITSLQNPLVKRIKLLFEKSRARAKQGAFVLEGLREYQLALKAGYQIEALAVCEDLLTEDIPITNNQDCFKLSKSLYEKLAYRGSTEGVLAIAKMRDHSLSTLQLQKDPLILVAVDIEKPGNLGAMMRTADAANIDALIIADPRVDLYNPNVIRSSVGCVFTNNIAMAKSGEVLGFLKGNNIKSYAATPSNGETYTSIGYQSSSALVVGSENQGLSQFWLEKADRQISIPMLGAIDSMNVSVSAAILIFEAKRQRGF